MVLNKNIRKWDIVLVNLDPTKGSEIRKTRPCIVISPDTLNRNLRTVIIAPLTSTNKNYPCRISANINDVQGEVCLDQIKSIDKSRIIKMLGKLERDLSIKVTESLVELFKED